MPNLLDIEKQIFEINTTKTFNDLALEIFHFQYENNVVYRQYVQNLGKEVSLISSIAEIPFLPIEFFKSHKVISHQKPNAIIFKSSGTSGLSISQHFVANLCMYESSFTKSLTLFYGDPHDYVFLALLPSYLERDGSSLVYMAKKLIQKSNYEESGFYLNDYNSLFKTLVRLKSENKKTILLGVTYALLDMVEQFPMNFPELIVMETGGMKGRRKEMVRQDLHTVLTKGFGVESIHSEYGMTELLSQAYSKGEGIFKCPPWMKIKVRDINDPFTYVQNGKTGGINIIDLANLYSCSFIETKDLGKIHADNNFEILGRFDNSDVRGCNLLVS